MGCLVGIDKINSEETFHLEGVTALSKRWKLSYRSCFCWRGSLKTFGLAKTTHWIRRFQVLNCCYLVTNKHIREGQTPLHMFLGKQENKSERNSLVSRHIQLSSSETLGMRDGEMRALFFVIHKIGNDTNIHETFPSSSRIALLCALKTARSKVRSSTPHNVYSGCS